MIKSVKRLTSLSDGHNLSSLVLSGELDTGLQMRIRQVLRDGYYRGSRPPLTALRIHESSIVSEVKSTGVRIFNPLHLEVVRVFDSGTLHQLSDILQGYPAEFAENNKTAFIHSGIYSPCLPPQLQHVRDICFSYQIGGEYLATHRLDALRSIIRRLLRSATHTSSFGDTLAHAQAISLAQIIRLLVCKDTFEDQVERDNEDMWALTHQLWQHAPIQLPSTLSPWQAWLFSESVRRTIMSRTKKQRLRLIKMGTSEPVTSKVADLVYPVGKILTFNASIHTTSSCQQKTIQVKINRQQLSYTCSSGSVVEEVSDFLDKPEGNNQFLKMFDRRAAEDLRDEWGAPPWSENIEKEYNATLDYVDENGSGWDEAEDEAFMEDMQRRLYEAEVATYDRLKEYQGKCIPQLLATVKLDTSPPNVALSAQQRELHRQKGIILEYLHGFTLRDMIEKAPESAWQDIVDQCLKVVDIFGDHDILNKDVRLDNFMIVPRRDKYQVFMIDFGQCRFRREGESDADWGRLKYSYDEEGFVRLMMNSHARRVDAAHDRECKNTCPFMSGNWVLIHLKFTINSHSLTCGDGFSGSHRLRDVLARFINRNFNPHKAVTKNQLIVTSGVGQAIELSGFSLCDKGDGVLLGRPHYGNFPIDFGYRAEAKIVGVSFGDIDPFSLEAVVLYEKALIDAQEHGIRVKVLLLCNPHNPLGRCYTSKVLQAYMKLCQKHSLHLLSDEIYALSVWKNENAPDAPEFTSVLSINTNELINANLLHVMWGMSKDFGANGIRIGCLITRNEAFMRACVANSEFSGPSSLSDLAAMSILSDDKFLETFIKTNRLRLAENYKIVTEFLASHNIPYKEGSNSGLFVWADLFAPNRTLIDNSALKQEDAGAALRTVEAKMTEALLKEKIFVASGGDFGTDVSGWYRIVFAHEKTYLLEGLERMVSAVEKFGRDLGIN
ncbi:unnamed protein product [Fusarium langsethiae]|nr:unnamed protein product [Fusarium langsethiae]